MAYVTGYEHDIFISYAQVDDQLLPDMERGWVTTLAAGLKTLLESKLREVSVWMDRELALNAPLTPALLDTLRHTAVLIVVMSPGYLKSEWCRRERETFLNLVRERTHGDRRIFIVESDKIERDERPAEFGDILPYRFWVQKDERRPARPLGWPFPKGEQEYYDQLNFLREQVEAELKSLKDAAEIGIAAPPARSGAAPVPGPTTEGRRDGPRVFPSIFLAEATDDLYLRREEVRGYLTQAGITVLPTTQYPFDPASYREALDRDLAGCALFVQLLSAVPGRRAPDLPQGYVGLQPERAAALGKPVFQWRSPDLKPDEVEDDAHRLLLTGADVRAEGIEDFKRAVVTRAFPPPPPARPAEDRFVFVSADPADRAEARALADRWLLPQGIAYAMPLDDADPARYAEWLASSLRLCDAALVVYHAADEASVFSQARLCRKYIALRDPPTPAFALYDGPPPEKPQLSFGLPNLRYLNCRADEAALAAFLQSLGGAAP